MQYNGKEKTEDFSLHWTDFGNRNQDPQAGRFWGVDKFADKYFALTPFHYAANNPILYIDVNGDSIVIDENGYTNRSVYIEGRPNYTQIVTSLLDQLRQTPEGEAWYNELNNSQHTFTIRYEPGQFRAIPFAEGLTNEEILNNSQTNGVGVGGIIQFDPHNDIYGATTYSDFNSNVEVMAHEIFGHGIDFNRGIADYTETDYQNPQTNGNERISNNELNASHRENIIRARMGTPLRHSYSGSPILNSTQGTINILNGTNYEDFRE
jgi:RHS repeat-associated protein